MVRPPQHVYQQLLCRRGGRRRCRARSLAGGVSHGAGGPVNITDGARSGCFNGYERASTPLKGAQQESSTFASRLRSLMRRNGADGDAVTAYPIMDNVASYGGLPRSSSTHGHLPPCAQCPTLARRHEACESERDESGERSSCSSCAAAATAAAAAAAVEARSGGKDVERRMI